MSYIPFYYFVTISLFTGGPLYVFVFMKRIYEGYE